jgi:hypothetical protein
MKILLLLSVSLISFNAFSSDLGEDKKSPCPYAVQSSSREAKPVVIEHTTEGEQVESEIKAIRK